jgi:hypothetical protein
VVAASPLTKTVKINRSVGIGIKFLLIRKSLQAACQPVKLYHGKHFEVHTEIKFMPNRKSSASKETGGHLDLDDDLAFHERGWKIQKIGWIIAFILLAFALAGFFGTGAVSRRTITHEGSSMEFERFLRFESEAELIFNVTNVRDTLILKVPQSYLTYIDVTEISPIPASNRIDENVITYYFVAKGHATIHCTLMAKKPGMLNETITVNNTPFEISHLIYP